MRVRSELRKGQNGKSPLGGPGRGRGKKEERKSGRGGRMTDGRGKEEWDMLGQREAQCHVRQNRRSGYSGQNSQCRRGGKNYGRSARGQSWGEYMWFLIK